jgi:NAD(P)-dependent dehydrogenase (short-subunit alcohol dehydrogenase family)
MQFANKVKVMVITGASSGIGRALRFAAEGGRMVVAEYSPEPPTTTWCSIRWAATPAGARTGC